MNFLRLALEYVENTVAHMVTCSFDHLTPAEVPLFFFMPTLKARTQNPLKSTQHMFKARLIMQ